MGKVNSKSNEKESFDYLKSTKKIINRRKKNIPICLVNKSDQIIELNSLSNENLVYFVENIILIWLDSSLEKLNESTQNTLNQINRITNIVQIFFDLEQCFHFINLIKDEKIFLIVSGSLGPQILPRIENFQQIRSIYIFCGNKANHEQWIKQYQQIKSIHTNIKELCNTIKNDIRQYDKSLTGITILPLTPINDIDETNKEFIYLQVMKGILLEMQYDKKFRKDFLDYSRKFYLNCEQQLKLINTFEENYHLHSPIWWYSRKCFIYSMLRKAFYFHDFEIIYKLAFFIRDLHKDIKKSHLQMHGYQHNIITVYRAAAVTNKELENLLKNEGALLSFNDFLLTTLERNIALKFAHTLRTEHNSIAVLYAITINPETSSIPYIALNNLTYLSDSDSEILFSMNTIFHITKIEKFHEYLYQINLLPANKKDDQIKELVDYMQETTHGLSGWYRLSKIMMDVEEYDQVEHIYKYIYDQTQEHEHEERAFLQHELGYTFELKNNLSASINHYKQAIQIYLSYLSPNHPTLLSTYTNLASVLEKQGDLNGALDEYQQAIKIKTPDDENKIIQYNNIAKILEQQGKYSDAQENYEKAIQIFTQNFSSNNPLLTDTYHNMAGMFYSLKDYSKALNYYEKTCEIEEKLLPLKHPTLVSTYFNIATTYEALHDYIKAMKYATKAIDTARLVFGNEHLETKENMKYLQQLQQISEIIQL